MSNIDAGAKSLEELAREKNLTMRDIAKKAKVSEVQLWRYNNRKRTPSIPIAAAIADMLGIDWKEVVELCKPIEEE